MRIGISLLCAKRNRTGMENVALNLIQTLAQINQNNKYVIYTTDRCRGWFALPSEYFQLINVKMTSHRCVWLWEQLFFHFDSRRKGLDLVHFSQAGGVVGYRGNFVLTIHDLSDYLGQHDGKLRQRLITSAWYKANVTKASLIVTVSNYVKNHILENFPVPPEKVRVVYNGVDERFGPTPDDESFRANYGLPDEYILFVGSSYPSKNIMRTIEAFRCIREYKQLKHHLIIVGGIGYEHNNLKDYVKQIDLEDVVHFGGYFPDQDLPGLYNHASLLVFPTLAEGFGIPPLEAMACGTPVVASDIPVMREILGDSAILVNPYSVDSIAEGIGKILLDNECAEKLIEKGYERVKMFSWRHTAKEMVRVYEEAVNS